MRTEQKQVRKGNEELISLIYTGNVYKEFLSAQNEIRDTSTQNDGQRTVRRASQHDTNTFLVRSIYKSENSSFSLSLSVR